MTSGIYVIRCKVTGKVYVGSSKNIKVRWRHHRRMLKSGIHHSIKLQRAWNKYGKDAFEFEIVEEVINGLLTVYEQIYIDYYNSSVNGYNILKIAGNVGNAGNPGQKNPLKKNATTFKVESGKEPRSDKPMCFRPTVSIEGKINAAIAESGLAKAQWLEAAVIAYLRQNSSVKDVLSEE